MKVHECQDRDRVYNEPILGRFPFVRTGRPDHCRTSHFNNEFSFFRGFLLKNHLLPTHCLGFDWSGWIVLINSEILITTERVWPVSSDKWKAPLVGLSAYTRADKCWAVKRALRSSFNVWCGVGLARALFPRFRCAWRPAKFSFLQTGNPIFFL